MLVGSLVVMVMFFGYENFVFKIDIDEGMEKLIWFGKMDVGLFKLKLFVLIVVILVIYFLKVYMEFNLVGNVFDEIKVMWFLILYMGFVVLALCMVLMDKLECKIKVEYG